MLVKGLKRGRGEGMKVTRFIVAETETLAQRSGVICEKIITVDHGRRY